jgi:hypothetical protein
MFKNMLCLLIIHLFACAEIFLFLFLSYGGLEPFYSLFSEPILDFFIPALLFFLLSRLLILPIAYKKLENSQNFALVAKFIQKLKQSWRLKTVVLVIAYFSYCNLGASYLDGGFYVKLRNGLFVGLLGNYLALYAYWFIESKIKNIIQKYRQKQNVNKLQNMELNGNTFISERNLYLILIHEIKRSTNEYYNMRLALGLEVA